MAHKVHPNSPNQGTAVADLDAGYQEIAGDGAITIKDGKVLLLKGTAAAITLAKPTAGLPYAGGDDGKELDIISTTAAAHVITCATDGFNAKGSSGTATFGAAIGNNCRLVARNGHWYNAGNTGCTYA